MRGPPPLRIELARSRLAVAFIVAAYLASATLIALMPFDALQRALAVVAIGAYAIRTLRIQPSANARAIAAVELSADGSVVLVEGGGARRQGRALATSYVGTAVVTLVTRVEGLRRARAIAIFPDMISAEEMRRLRVLLRVGGSSQPGAEPP